MRGDRIKHNIISHPLVTTGSSIMAANIQNTLLQKGIFILWILIQGLNLVSSEGICTRSEVVSKKRLYTYTKMDQERYLDHYCYQWSSYHNCLRTRNVIKPITEIQTYTETELQQYCCAGYEKTSSDGSNLVCEPVCSFTCSNGKCTKPDYCDCDTGYSKKPGTENICDPVCSQECVHGYCSKPEYCSCDYGYDHNASSPYVCSPVCSTPCINADCTSPDVCTCLKGFAKTPKEPHRCHPVCSQHCWNGVCTAPEECSCFEGFEKGHSWNVCDPVCQEGCENGECTAPGECTCFPGFEKNDSVCQPKCSQECLNGVCVGPDLCSCYPGYQMNLDDPYSCLPVCSSGCVNGNCTDPDRCECYPGYEEADSNVCRPRCSDGCEHGICTEPEVCTCLWGFEKGNSSCTRRDEENHNCTLVSELVNHHFDKYCFHLGGELSSASFKNCDILQYLATYSEGIGRELYLNCKRVSDLEGSERRFDLRMECMMELTTAEVSSEETTSTEVYQDSSSAYESTLNDYELSTYYKETTIADEDPLSTEISETTQSPTECSQIYTFGESGKNQREFNIIFKGRPAEATQLSALPLHLNLTLKFLSLIERSQLTQDYFVNFTSVKRDLCLCHRNQTNWSICADSMLLLHLCPCQPKKLQVLFEESPESSRTTVIMFIVMAALVPIGYILYKKYQFGSYIII